MSHKAYLPDTKDKVYCDTAYRNQIIGGVIQRKPMKPVSTDQSLYVLYTDSVIQY